MIEALIDIRRLERHETSLNFIACGLHGVADKAISALSAAATQAEVRVNNLIAADFPPVNADENLMYRVFFHLLDNALRHTPNGGTVRIEATQFQDKGVGFGNRTRPLDRIFGEVALTSEERRETNCQKRRAKEQQPAG